jgi:AcrR family transcriptional regulator
MTDTAPARRRYDSPVRRRQAAETRERILTAGAELLHGFPTWNWTALTVRAAAERAGVTERTVYRYFATERDLRDAVLERFEEESGVEVEGLALEEVAAVTARMFEYVSSFPVEPRTPRDETVAAANARQRAALLAALAPYTDAWSSSERAVASAVLDVLWSVVSYERMVVDWELAPTDAIRGLTWAIELVATAVRAGDAPRATMPEHGRDHGTDEGER